MATAALGVGGVGWGLVERPGALRAGANEFVDDRSAASAHNSPAVAVDPRQPSTIVVANRLDAPELGCAVSASANAGVSWQRVELTPGLAAVNCFWPRVAYLPDGTLLVLYTELGGPNVLPLAVWLQRYADLRPVGAPQRVAGDLAFHARMAVAGSGVWLTWVQAGPATADNQLGFAPGDNPVVVARSGDGGRTFQPPVRVSEPGLRVIQPTIVAGLRGPNAVAGLRGPNAVAGMGGGDGLAGMGGAAGQVVVGALDLGDDVANYEATHDGQTPPDPRLRWRIVAWSSGDGGATFGPASVVAADLPVPQLIIADLGPAPGFAADPARGRVYAAWDAGRGDARDCYVAFSDDGGRRWSTPVRVGPRRGSQLLPAVAVSPGGRVDVVLYDRSADDRDVLQDVVVATSTDGGRTFRWATVSDAAFDSRIGLGAQQGVPLQGDNLAVLPRDDDLLAFWADTSRGTRTANVQDLAVAGVEVGSAGGRRWPLVWVGVALLFAGGALGAVARQSAD